MAKTEKIVAFSCTHIPLQDNEYMGWLHDIIDEVRPDHLVHLGDLFEAKSVSRFKTKDGKSYYPWTLVDEYRAADRLLFDLADTAKLANPGVQLVLTEGNHDWNIRAWERSGQDLAGVIDYREYTNRAKGIDLENTLSNWLWKPYVNDPQRAAYRVGPVVLCHGFYTSKMASRDMALEYADPWGLYVGGHTHQPVPPTQAMWIRPVEKFYMNVGTARDIWDVRYMEQNSRLKWGQAAAVIETAVPRYPTYIKNGRAWDAELRVFRMFSDKPAILHNEVPV
jgi:predicted phosphodiesterase